MSAAYIGMNETVYESPPPNHEIPTPILLLYYSANSSFEGFFRMENGIFFFFFLSMIGVDMYGRVVIGVKEVFFVFFLGGMIDMCMVGMYDS